MKCFLFFFDFKLNFKKQKVFKILTLKIKKKRKKTKLYPFFKGLFTLTNCFDTFQFESSPPASRSSSSAMLLLIPLGRYSSSSAVFPPNFDYLSSILSFSYSKNVVYSLSFTLSSSNLKALLSF